MALQSQIYSVGDLAWGSWSNAYILDLVLTEESVSQVDNTSLISYKLQLRSGPQNRFAEDVDSSVTLGGALAASGREYKYLDFNSVWTLLSGQMTVAHNADGSKDLTFSASISPDSGNQWAPPDMTVSGTMTLTRIPRASTLAATSAAVTQRSAVAVTKQSDACTHSIAYRFGSLSGYLTREGGVSSQEVIMGDTLVLFSLPESFYYEIPNAPSGVCELICTTYLGGVVLGEPQSAAFTVTTDGSLCGPTLSASVEDCLSTTLALTGGGSLVRGRSNALCRMEAAGRYGASIVKSYVNNIAMDQELVLPQVSTGSFVFRTVDSRGHEASRTVTVPMVDYIPLTVLSSAKRTGPTSSEGTLTVRGTCFSGSFGAAQNSLRLLCRVGDAEAVSLEPVFDGDSYSASAALRELDYRAAHTITIEAADELDQVTVQTTLLRGIPVFDWGEGDFTFHVPVNFEGGLDFVYPVGAVYMSTVSTAPGTLFGGTWERLKDRFLLAAGDSYGAGATGGAATVALTTNEMPGHTHTAATGTAGSHTHKVWGYMTSGKDGSCTAADAYTERSQSDADIQVDPAGDHTHTVTVNSAGGGQAHNNMPPYLAVYMWKRTA